MSEENDEMSALVPRLRFPEFQGDPWEAKPLEQVAPLQRGFDLPSSELQPGDIPVVYSNGVQSFHCTAMAKAPGLVTGRSGTIGKLNFIEKGEYWPHNTSLWVTSFKGNVPKFVYFLFNSIGMERFASGSGVPTLNRNDVHAFVSAVPKSLAEQEQIADCLSSLDELITAESQKLDALKTHKKGLMQQLFPREGETVPRLRFPEFLEAGAWEEKLIEDFFDVGSSKRVLQEDWTTQGVPFYRTRELVSLSKNEPFGSEIFISEALFCEISEKYGLPTEGDFLVSGVGTLGISYQVRAQDRFYFKDGNVLWLKLRGGIVSTFFKYCFEADEIQNQILAQASISTVGTYTIQNAKVTKFSCPTNIEEQQEIADCLSSLDDLITAQSQTIGALRTHKKGLMQQLFPVLDEVSA